MDWARSKTRVQVHRQPSQPKGISLHLNSCKVQRRLLMMLLRIETIKLHTLSASNRLTRCNFRNAWAMAPAKTQSAKVLTIAAQAPRESVSLSTVAAIRIICTTRLAIRWCPVWSVGKAKAVLIRKGPNLLFQWQAWWELSNSNRPLTMECPTSSISQCRTNLASWLHPVVR